jgi:hypothetical protein
LGSTNLARLIGLSLCRLGGAFLGFLAARQDDRKRAAAFHLLCQLGNHPTYAGFRMLQAKGSNLVIVGPFFEPASLDAVLSELAKAIMQAGGQARHAEECDIADYRLWIDYLIMQANWLDRFFSTKTGRSQIEFIRQTVDEMERRGGVRVRS